MNPYQSNPLSSCPTHGVSIILNGTLLLAFFFLAGQQYGHRYTGALQCKTLVWNNIAGLILPYSF
jgi:hypothetical protein